MSIFKLEPILGEKLKNHLSHLPQQPELVEQLLTQGQLMMLAGKYEIGKTNELFHLMMCFSYGVPWHGLKVTPKKSLYITWEGDPNKIADRLELIEKQYRGKDKEEKWWFKMMDQRIPLDTSDGRKILLSMVDRMEEKPEVIFLDPFKRTLLREYLKPSGADIWIEGANSVARDAGAALITSNHTRKITYRHNDPPDVLGADKVKGAGDLLDGVSCAILIAEEMGSRRLTLPGGYSKVEWKTLNRVIKVLKAKDATAEFPLLRVDFDRSELKHKGQKWCLSKSGEIKIEKG